MDQTHEQLQFLGIVGIVNQSVRSILRAKKIFALVTITLIVSLAYIFKLNIDMSHGYFSDTEMPSFGFGINSYPKDYHAEPNQTVWIQYIIFNIVINVTITVLSMTILYAFNLRNCSHDCVSFLWSCNHL